MVRVQWYHVRLFFIFPKQIQDFIREGLLACLEENYCVILWPKQYSLQINDYHKPYGGWYSPKILAFLPCPSPFSPSLSREPSFLLLLQTCPHIQSYWKYLQFSEDFLALFLQSLSSQLQTLTKHGLFFLRTISQVQREGQTPRHSFDLPWKNKHITNTVSNILGCSTSCDFPEEIFILWGFFSNPQNLMV